MKDRAAQILLECAELLEKKSADYNNGQDRSVYYPFGDQLLFTLVWTKIMRIRSVMDKDQTNFESLEDSLRDLANYSAIWIHELEKRKPKCGEIIGKRVAPMTGRMYFDYADGTTREVSEHDYIHTPIRVL